MANNVSDKTQHPEKNNHWGVMMVNLGTPEAPTPKAVRTYLKEFLSDIRVVDAPRLIWFFVLKIILLIRPRPVAHAYQSVWTKDGSPLLVISKKQRAALSEQLKSQTGKDVPVALAMTYGSPSVEQAAAELRQAGVEKILFLPMYPQYSSSTTAAVYDRVSSSLKACPHLPEMRWIRDYHDEQAYIASLANSVKEHWAEHGKAEKLMMSFHGVPKRYTLKGDPYEFHCHTTAKLLAQALELADDEWICSFQSRFGREEWLKPYTDETLKTWAQDGVKSVDIICPAFAADCLETLEEIQVENRDYFIEAGGKEYRYIPALNDRTDHIKALADLVERHTQGWE